MSWQAQTAVNHKSKQANLGLFRLLLYLAEKADETGCIDPAPSQDTLAEFFEVSDWTIRNWLNNLMDSCELVRTRRGRGEGNPSAYQINLPMPEVTGNYQETGKLTGNYGEMIMGNVSGNYEEINRKLTERLENLEEKIAAFLPVMDRLQEIEERLTGITGSVNRKGHSLKSADDPYDPTMIQEEREELPADGGGVIKETPYQVYERLLGLEPGMTKGQSLKEIKTMLNGTKTFPAYSGDDIVNCGAFLQTERWRQEELIPLTTRFIMQKITKWVEVGRPKDYDTFKAGQPSHSPNGRHSSKPKDDTMARLEARLAAAMESDQ